MNFDVEFPVVGRVRFRRLDDNSESLTVSDVYFHPLAERLGLLPTVPATELFRLYAFGEGPWDVEGGPWILTVEKPLVERLRWVAEQGFSLDMSRIVCANGLRPTPAETVLAAMIGFFEAAEASGTPVEVTTLP